MTTLRDIYSDSARNLLAICLVYKGIYILLKTNLIQASVSSFMGMPEFWTVIIGCFWIITALSLTFNLITKITCNVLALVSFIILILSAIGGTFWKYSLPGTLLWLGEYLVIIGCSLMIGAQADNNQTSGNHITFSLEHICFATGRTIMGLFFLIVGFLHFMYLKEEAQLITMMPSPVFWVIFVGICWLATGVSLITNIMTKTSCLLASLLVVIITLIVDLRGLGFENDYEVVLRITQNIGVVGGALVSGSMGYYDLHRSSWRYLSKVS